MVVCALCSFSAARLTSDRYVLSQRPNLALLRGGTTKVSISTSKRGGFEEFQRHAKRRRELIFSAAFLGDRKRRQLPSQTRGNTKLGYRDGRKMGGASSCCSSFPSQLTAFRLTSAQIVVDFGTSAGKNLTMSQQTLFADVDYAGSDKLLQFRVGTAVTSAANNGALRSQLVDIPALKTPPSATQTFIFSRKIGAPWTINGKSWTDPVSRILANPPLGTVAKWVFRGAGGWSHREFPRDGDGRR